MGIKQVDDKVWWDRPRKLRGIVDEITQLTRTGNNVLLVAHFEASLNELEAALRSGSCAFQRLASFDSSTAFSSSVTETGKVLTALARSLPTAKPSADVWNATRLKAPATSIAGLQILVAEHHPLRSRDEQIIRAGETMDGEGELTFHISLDDPLLTNFGVRSIQDLGRRLGVDEDSFLSNPLITRSIRQAQEKIEKKVPRDLPAVSIEDWFCHNLPSG